MQKIPEESTSNLVSLARSSPIVSVDCTTWDNDIPEDQWSHGDLVSLTRSLPVVKVDGSDWDRDRPAKRLEVVVRFEDHADPAQVKNTCESLVQRLAEAYPEWKLTYDPTRSRAEQGDVILALAVHNESSPHQHFAELAEWLQTSLSGPGHFQCLQWAA